MFGRMTNRKRHFYVAVLKIATKYKNMKDRKRSVLRLHTQQTLQNNT